MNDLSFRKATAADVPGILKLVRAAYRTKAGWTTEADIVVDDRIDETGLLEKINAPHGQVLLAFSAPAGAAPEDERLLSCCELARLPEPSKSGYIGLFSVSPAAQNAGIGRKVLAEAERWAREEMGASVMEMQVLWMRPELISYYERRGYKMVEGETRPFPYEHLVNPREGTRDDLHFVILKKALA